MKWTRFLCKRVFGCYKEMIKMYNKTSYFIHMYLQKFGAHQKPDHAFKILVQIENLLQFSKFDNRDICLTEKSYF